MPLKHWAPQDIQQTTIAGGFTIVIKTNCACHLWLRHTLVAPQKHPKPVMRRGLLIMYDARFCFVAFEDLEQNEPGDTYTHTFTWTGWELCQTRYFYFWATSAGIPMLSTSCLFSKHFTYVPPPPPTIFYPDAHPETTTVDGHTRAAGYYLGWAALVGADGVGFNDNAQTFDVGFGSTIYTNYWGYLHRPTLLYDLSSLPPGTTIVAAKLSFYLKEKFNNFTFQPAVAVYESYPDSNTALVPADYQHFYDTILSDKINFTDLSTTEKNSLTLNALGISKLVPGEIAKLALRETNYDAPNLDPGWENDKDFYLHIWSADKGDPYKPALELTLA